MKKRTISLLLVVLAFCMLFGVGFAAWVISNGASQEADGQISVDTVTDDRVSVTDAGWVDNKDTIVFGYDADYVLPEGAWLTVDNGLAQNMSVTYQFKVLDDVGVGTFDANVTATIEYAEGLSFGNLVVAPTTVTPVETATTGVYTITIEFTWGSDFGNVNPIKYFNELSGGVDTNGDAALEKLTALNLLNNTADFTLHINVAK